MTIVSSRGGGAGLDPASASGIDRAADRIAAALRAHTDEPDLDALIERAVRREEPLVDDFERHRLRSAVRARLGGLDQLDPLLDDPSIDEILVGGGRVWVERQGTVSAIGEIDDATTRRVVERVLAPLGRRLDRTTPIVDARLPDGSRVCAVIEPIAVDGPTLSIRRFADRIRSLDEFLDDAATGPIIRQRCEEVVERRCNVLVSGATSSGKTSLLGALLSLAEDADRIVLLEDTAELPCHAPHLVRLEARPATIDGPDAISVEQLVRTALRLRPDRLVIGEVRGDEVLALLQAMNTGHDGSFSTCHANGATDALLRIESLVVRAAPRWPLAAVRHTIARSLDVIIHVERQGSRRIITEVAEVVVGADADAPLRTRAIDADALRRGRR